MTFHEDDPEGQRRVALLRQGLKELGWTEGRNIHFEYRWFGGDAARAKANAAELVSQKPDVIVANSTLSLTAVRNETSTIPIVFMFVGDPIGQGFVSSFAHPGGNITGFTSFEFSTGAKWLELIKEIAPELGRIAFIFNPEAGPYAEKFVQSIVSRRMDLLVRSVSKTTRAHDQLYLLSHPPAVEPGAVHANESLCLNAGRPANGTACAEFLAQLIGFAVAVRFVSPVLLRVS